MNRKIVKILLILAVAVLALGLRTYAAQTLPGEPPELPGVWAIPVVLGSAAALALTVLNPLAGAFLAVHSFAVWYTGQVPAEAFALLAGLLGAVCYLRWFRTISTETNVHPGVHIWLGLSVILAGTATAAQSTYLSVGVAIALHFAIRAWKNRTIWQHYRPAAVWVALSLYVLLLVNPRLLPLLHPLAAAQNPLQAQSYPAWQPLVWLSASMPAHFPLLKPAFLVTVDLWIALMALLGLLRLWKRYALFLIWLAAGFAFLLANPDRGPASVVTILVPLCMSAAEGVRLAASLIRRLVFRLARTPIPQETEQN